MLNKKVTFVAQAVPSSKLLCWIVFGSKWVCIMCLHNYRSKRCWNVHQVWHAYFKHFVTMPLMCLVWGPVRAHCDGMRMTCWRAVAARSCNGKQLLSLRSPSRHRFVVATTVVASNFMVCKLAPSSLSFSSLLKRLLEDTLCIRSINEDVSTLPIHILIRHYARQWHV